MAGWGRAAEELVSGLVAIGCGCGLATGCVDELLGAGWAAGVERRLVGRRSEGKLYRGG